MRSVVQCLPRTHRDTLHYLVCHLKRVSSRSDENKMDSTNLSIVFGPTLIRAPTESFADTVMNIGSQNQAMEMIIQHADFMFAA